MLLKKLLLVLVLGVFGFGLTACGGDDSGAGSSGTSESMSSGGGSSSGAVEAYDPDVPSMVVEDNGVIHQEEIYKAWPQ
ncbi:MAG: hypothetical protein KAI15_08490 [Gammaproteobacteria bacterium]|nr:hypothetical protein [Gammaproteobacteria bacterium]